MADVDLADPKVFFSQIRTILRSVNICESKDGKDPWALGKTTWYENGAECEDNSSSPAVQFMEALEGFEGFEASWTGNETEADFEAHCLNTLAICLEQTLRMDWNAGRSLMQTLADASRERQSWG